jgi:DNA-binding phage protein
VDAKFRSRIAEQAGVHRATLYRAIMENRLSAKSQEALSPVLLFMSQTGM